MHASDIQVLIQAHLPDCQAMVEGADGVHFEALVVSPAFIDKNRIQKQQMVYAALGNRIQDGTIHALTIKTFTPEEWIKHNG
jgi:acid stress-induced BolA-like protein IbaG/YrbA